MGMFEGLVREGVVRIENVLRFEVEHSLPYIHDAECSEIKADATKFYENIIPEEFQKQVKNIKGQCLLIVGDSIKELRATKLAEYFYLLTGQTYGCFYELSGEGEAEVKKKFKEQCSFFDGNTNKTGDFEKMLEKNCSIILIDLKCEACNLLEKLRTWICKSQDSWQYSGRPGMVVITTLTPIENIPTYFASLFEIISLELATEQIAPAAPAGAPVNEQQNTANTPQKQGRTKAIAPIPTPPGTQWNEVKFSLIDDEYVKITIKKQQPLRMHFSVMGFQDAKSGKPIKLRIFLKELADLSGRFTNYPANDKEKVKGYFKDLRKVLKHNFETIQGDPVPYKSTKDYKGYETAFTIEGKSYDDYENKTREHLKTVVEPKNRNTKQQADDSEDREDREDDDT